MNFRSWHGYAWALAAATAATLLATPLNSHLDLANIAMFYVLAVVAIAYRFGRGPAVAAAIFNVVAFDFFFVPPRFSFAVADGQYLLTFAVMLATGLVIAHLTERLKQQVAAAKLGAQRSRDLYEMAQRLSGALTDEQIIEAAAQFFARSFDARVVLMIRDREGNLAMPPKPAQAGLREMDMPIARCAFDDATRAETLKAGSLFYVPLKAPMRIRGVLVVAPADPAVFDDPDQRQQRDTVAVLIAIALERVHFVAVAREATVQMEGERLRNVLLAALSHDLRTPLTAILGSAESLQIRAAGLTNDQSSLVDVIRDQARRTNDLVEKILAMARLESGVVRLRKEWQALEEIVGSALKARAQALAAHAVTVTFPQDLPLIECDATLIEHVFVNLLENAAKYTPRGSEIRITACMDTDKLRVDIIDIGPGVPHGQESAIFEKFVRAHAAEVPGLGLGLAICRAIIEAHGGRIWMENLPVGGADFAFTLPGGQPPSMEIEMPVAS